MSGQSSQNNKVTFQKVTDLEGNVRYVQNNNSNSITGIKQHAVHQAIDRGFSPQAIQKIVNEGTAVNAMGRYGPQVRYSLGGNTVVLNANGEIITVFSNAPASSGIPKGFFISFE